jgi:hypothetical protein
MKKLFTIFCLLSISVVMIAQRPSGLNVTTLWEKSAANGNLPAYIGASSNCHAMALGMMNGNPYLYVVTREPGYYGTHIVNAANGEEVGTLINPSEEYLAQGYFPINAVEVAADGAIFVCSMAQTTKNILNVYMYKSHSSAPKLVFSMTAPSGRRLGDRFIVTGKYSDGSAKLYFADYGTAAVARPLNELYVLKLIADPSAAGEYVCALEEVKNIESNPDPETKNNNLAIYLPVGSGYYWMSTTGGLYYNNGTTGSRIYSDQFKNRSTGPYYAGERNGKHYMAYYEWEPGIAYFVSYTLPATEGGATIEAVTPNFCYDGGDVAQNAYAYGGVAVDWRGAKPIIYYLGYNYGIGAYQVNSLSNTDIKTPVADKFSVKQNGSVLQFTGKEDIQSIELINLTGQRVASNHNASEISVAGQKGVYLVNIKSISGQQTVQKVLIK